MKITFKMLSFILKEQFFSDFSVLKHCEYREQIENSDMDIAHIRFLPSDGALQNDTLYIASEPALNERSAVTADHKASLLIAKDPDTAALLLEVLLDIMQRLIRWDAAFSEGILLGQDACSLFAKGSEFLPYDYSIVDIDMNVAYCTPGYALSRAVDGGRVSEEVFQDLVTHKEFHDLASRQGIFYYYASGTDSWDLCRNIFIHGQDEQYIARAVLVLPHGLETLPRGAEQLFAVFSDHVQEIYSHLNLRPVHHSDDNMHRLCLALLGEQPVSPDALREVLRTYRWEADHRYTVVLL